MTRTEATKILIRKIKEIKSDYIIGVFDNCIMSVEIQEDGSVKTKVFNTKPIVIGEQLTNIKE